LMVDLNGKTKNNGSKVMELCQLWCVKEGSSTGWQGEGEWSAERREGHGIRTE
jgi:hypothetical protein